jgi:hypothetical protein
MERKSFEMKSKIETKKWQAPEVSLMTRKKPERSVAKKCCGANFSLTDSGCSGPLHD